MEGREGVFGYREPLHRYKHCNHWVFLRPEPLQRRYRGVTGRYKRERDFGRGGLRRRTALTTDDTGNTDFHQRLLTSSPTVGSNKVGTENAAFGGVDAFAAGVC